MGNPDIESDDKNCDVGQEKASSCEEGSDGEIVQNDLQCLCYLKDSMWNYSILLFFVLLDPVFDCENDCWVATIRLDGN